MENTILLIATSLISGLLATIMTLIVQNKAQKKQAKQKIFENIFLTKDGCCVIIFEPHIVGFVSCARNSGMHAYL